MNQLKAVEIFFWGVQMGLRCRAVVSPDARGRENPCGYCRCTSENDNNAHSSEDPHQHQRGWKWEQQRNLLWAGLGEFFLFHL